MTKLFHLLTLSCLFFGFEEGVGMNSVRTLIPLTSGEHSAAHKSSATCSLTHSHTHTLTHTPTAQITVSELLGVWHLLLPWVLVWIHLPDFWALFSSGSDP